MLPEDNQKNPQRPCPEFELRLILYAADELDRPGRAEVAAHTAQCTACAAALARERSLLDAVTSKGVIEPSAELLASCRDVLEDAIDELVGAEQPGFLARWAEKLYPGSWFALHPALSAALFILIGFSVGGLAPRLFRSLPTNPVAVNSGVVPLEQPTAAQIDQVLPSADIAGITWTPAADNESPRVQMQLNAEQPLVVQGTVDSSDVKRVLLYVLHNNQQFSPDVRLDSVELLRTRSNDPEVRQALCNAVHTDRNAAVRLKALEALNGAEPQDLIRKTLIDALIEDSNPGVRIEAINELRALADRGAVEPDVQLLSVLRERMQKDPSRYIRIQSASVIQDLGPREKY